MVNSIFLCKICNKSFNSIRALASHINAHKITTQEYYDTYLKAPEEEYCNYCHKNKTKFLSLGEGYQKFCCAKCGGLGSATTGKATMLAKYGVGGINNVNKSKEWRNSLSDSEKTIITDKMKATRIKNYGSLTASYESQTQKSLIKKQERLNQFELLNNCTLTYSLVYKYGQGWYKAGIITDFLYDNNISFIKNSDISKIINYVELTKNNQTSHAEKDLLNYIKTIYEGQIINNTKNILENYEIDIFIPKLNIGIEYNGTYWHSNKIKQNRYYHFNKSKLAESKGIRLIHIYEYEWTDPIQQEKIKLMLNIALKHVYTKIYARQCTIKQITNKEAKILNNKVHLQGHRNAQVTYGLFYKGELVQLMSFSKTKYNKNLKNENDWEIIRGCPGSNNIVVGGVSKLFKHFINDYNPISIFSYCDFNKFNGKSYESLGMSFVGYTGPDMKWILKDWSVINRSPSKHVELKKQAIDKIYGAGSKKYIWKK